MDIMKKDKSGEMSSVSDTLMSKEKPQSDMLKMYSQGELSADVGKTSSSLEGFAKVMYKQGDLSKVADGK